MNRVWLGAISCAVWLGACAKDEPRPLGVDAEVAPLSDAPTEGDDGGINPALLRRFAPLEEPTNHDPKVVALGRKLFGETRLSKDQSLSCNSCHDLARHGVDGRKTSDGVGGRHGRRNSPTVFNAAGQFRMFWDGRVETAKEQALMPVLNPDEMAMPSEESVVKVLKADSAYVEAFASAFPKERTPLTAENVAIALSEFEATLVTPSRWDQYLRGDKRALTPAETKGLAVFLNVGCMVCHTGRHLGGSMYQKAGAVVAWPNQEDLGRFEVTKSADDKMMFKVPTLRNIAETAPYFHDGSAATLEEAIGKMGHHQLGVELSSDEVASIRAWLDTLTGEVPKSTVGVVPTSAPVRSCEGGACSLGSWMAANAEPALRDKDFKKLKIAFGAIAGRGRPAYPNWGSFAERGVTASANEDIAGATAACTGCHKAYRAKYVASDVGGLASNGPTASK